MKKKEREKFEQQAGKFKVFASEYLTPRNLALGLGIGSLAGIATYSTVRALKNEQLVNRIRKELNFNSLKKNLNSTLGGIGILKKPVKPAPEKKSERAPAKSKRSTAKPASRKKAGAK